MIPHSTFDIRNSTFLGNFECRMPNVECRRAHSHSSGQQIRRTGSGCLSPGRRPGCAFISVSLRFSVVQSGSVVQTAALLPTLFRGHRVYYLRDHLFWSFFPSRTGTSGDRRITDVTSPWSFFIKVNSNEPSSWPKKFVADSGKISTAGSFRCLLVTCSVS